MNQSILEAAREILLGEAKVEIKESSEQDLIDTLSAMMEPLRKTMVKIDTNDPNYIEAKNQLESLPPNTIKLIAKSNIPVLSKVASDFLKKK